MLRLLFSIILFGRRARIVGRPGAGCTRVGGTAPAGRGALDRIDLRPEILGPDRLAEHRRFLCDPLSHRIILDDRALIVEIKIRSEEHTSELQSLMRISYAVFCLKKKKESQDYT